MPFSLRTNVCVCMCVFSPFRCVYVLLMAIVRPFQSKRIIHRTIREKSLPISLPLALTQLTYTCVTMCVANVYHFGWRAALFTTISCRPSSSSSAILIQLLHNIFLLRRSIPIWVNCCFLPCDPINKIFGDFPLQSSFFPSPIRTVLSLEIFN